MKKSIKLFCAVAAALLLMFPFAACGKEKATGEYVINAYKSDSRLKIMAWECYFGGYNADGKLNQQYFDDCADAGFTVLLPLWHQFDFANNQKQASDIMDCAEKAGLSVMVHDSDISGARYSDKSVWNTKNVHLYKDREGFLGLAMVDEPTARDYTWIKAKHDKFLETFGADTDKLFYTNLYPSFVGGGTLGAITFKAYLDDYLRVTGANILSYDNYALFKDNSVRESFFSDAETARKVAKKHNTPAVNFLQAVPHTGMFNYKDPTEADLRWQIAVGMAYGLDGFAYFTYASPYNGTDAWEYGDALVSNSQFGTGGIKLEKYYYAQTVNKEALAWDDVYLSFDWQKTYAMHAAAGNQRFELFDLVQDVYDAEIDVIEGVKSVRSSRELLFGDFTDKDGNKGFMLTNATTPFEDKTASVTLELNASGKNGQKAYAGVQVYERGVPRIIDLDKKGCVTIDVGPGDGTFVIPLVRNAK